MSAPELCDTAPWVAATESARESSAPAVQEVAPGSISEPTVPAHRARSAKAPSLPPPSP